MPRFDHMLSDTREKRIQSLPDAECHFLEKIATKRGGMIACIISGLFTTSVFAWMVWSAWS